jgi:hypothetical protein
MERAQVFWNQQNASALRPRQVRYQAALRPDVDGGPFRL